MSTITANTTGTQVRAAIGGTALNTIAGLYGRQRLIAFGLAVQFAAACGALDIRMAQAADALAGMVASGNMTPGAWRYLASLNLSALCEVLAAVAADVFTIGGNYKPYDLAFYDAVAPRLAGEMRYAMLPDVPALV